MKLWNVFRYETQDGKLFEGTRTALMMPLPDKSGCKYLADEGNKLAESEGLAVLFRVEAVKS